MILLSRVRVRCACFSTASCTSSTGLRRRGVASSRGSSYMRQPSLVTRDVASAYPRRSGSYPDRGDGTVRDRAGPVDAVDAGTAKVRGRHPDRVAVADEYHGGARRGGEQPVEEGTHPVVHVVQALAAAPPGAGQLLGRDDPLGLGQVAGEPALEGAQGLLAQGRLGHGGDV